MRHSLLFSIILCVCTAATAYGTDDITKLNCDITDVQEVYWPVLDETVTLTTHLTTGENPWPDGKLTLTIADGTKIDLGEGSKYIDDFDPKAPPTCQDHLSVAQSRTLGSLKADPAEGKTGYPYKFGAPEFRSMRELEAALTQAQLCSETEGRRCDYEEFLIERVEQLKISQALYTELIMLDAPIIEVTGSVYYIEVYALHPHTKTLHALYPNGC